MSDSGIPVWFPVECFGFSAEGSSADLDTVPPHPGQISPKEASETIHDPPPFVHEMLPGVEDAQGDTKVQVIESTGERDLD